MPLVFVHGVRTREADFKRLKKQLEPHLRTAMRRPDEVSYAGMVEFVYWGDLGVVLPQKGLRSLHLDTAGRLGSGPADDDVPRPNTDIVAIANESFAGAVDVLFLSALTSARIHGLTLSGETLRAAQELAALALRQDEQGTAPTFHSEKELLDLLEAELRLIEEGAPAGDVSGRTLGTSPFAWVASGAKWVKDRAANAATLAGLWLIRDGLSRLTAELLGDILCYLDSRGNHKAPGEILQRVAEKVHAAAEKRRDDDPLILVGHSLGGVILADWLSGFAPHGKPELEVVDGLVTVGSQVGLFAEFSRLRTQNGAHLAANQKLGPLPRVTRWINVFDRADALSFAAAPVFKKVEDYVFSGDVGFIAAHSAYLERPALHAKIRQRLLSVPAS